MLGWINYRDTVLKMENFPEAESDTHAVHTLQFSLTSKIKGLTTAVYESSRILMLCYLNRNMVMFVKWTWLFKTDHETEISFMPRCNPHPAPDLTLQIKMRHIKHNVWPQWTYCLTGRRKVTQTFLKHTYEKKIKTNITFLGTYIYQLPTKDPTALDDPFI